MMTQVRNQRAAFTLLEIMIIVAIIGMLAALATPVFIKARKRSQIRRIMNDVRQMDAAVSKWALEFGKKDGDTILTTEVASYLKAAWPENDPLGNSYIINKVGVGQIKIADDTKTAFSGVDTDWGIY